ncbi:hypothetical protein [Mesorhizobium sp. SP-1A]|uniref:hypothetical protein n=1 Tax=Mesorhizobium sp. SP-1A TaxID=3077840 RepID=UPI0028F70562|nr:hypothetical protein [Mesorhizobium sp. SP-1A]
MSYQFKVSIQGHQNIWNVPEKPSGCEIYVWSELSFGICPLNARVISQISRGSKPKPFIARKFVLAFRKDIQRIPELFRAEHKPILDDNNLVFVMSGLSARNDTVCFDNHSTPLIAKEVDGKWRYFASAKDHTNWVENSSWLPNDSQFRVEEWPDRTWIG